MRKQELYFGIFPYLLLTTGIKCVVGDNDKELKTCDSNCENEWNAQLKQDIPQFCDHVERRCTSCRGQCQYNRRRGINLKCVCYCKKYHPEFKPYPLQSVCPDQSENLAVDTGKATAGESNKLAIGLGAGITVSVILTAVIIIIIFQVYKRLKSNNESNGETTVSRDPLLDQRNKATGDAQPVQDTGDSSEYIYVVDAQKQASSGIVAQEEQQDENTTGKDVDRQPAPNPKPQNKTTAEELPVESKDSDPHGPMSEEDSILSHGNALDAPVGPLERQIKDQERNIRGKAEKVPCD